MKPKVYLETTIPSYLVSGPSRDLIVAAHQEITREWWSARRDQFHLFSSQFVISESSAGDKALAQARLRLLQSVPQLEIVQEVSVLAEALITEHAVPQKAAGDAAHIAVAAVHSVDYLMTWNCAHLANATMRSKIREVCRAEGYMCPVICTPEELMEG